MPHPYALTPIHKRSRSDSERKIEEQVELMTVPGCPKQNDPVFGSENADRS